MPRLAAVPEVPRRVLGIVRVSKEREEMTSPEVQRHAIETYCQTAGHQLVEVVEGIDESGSSSRSKWWRTLDQAVEAVEAGTYDGIVVWKFSRVARHRLKWAVALDRVEAAGGILESATEQFDTSTSAGRFARGMTAEMNAFQAEMIGDTWREAHERRVRAGLPHSGTPRYGYRRNPDTKMFEPHPVQGPILVDLAHRYVAGETFKALALWLNRHQHLTARGSLWTAARVAGMLDSGFAAGLITYHGQTFPGVHEPLLDAGVWQAYLDARQARRTMPRARLGSKHLLSGLVRCAECGRLMVISPDSKGVVGVQCRRRREVGPVGCVGAYMPVRVVEDAVLAAVRVLAGGVNESAASRRVVAARRSVSASEVKRLDREALRVEEALVRLVTAQALDPVAESVFREARSQLEEQAARLGELREVAARGVRAVGGDRSRVAADLLRDWDVLPVGVRREVLGSLVDCVLVRGRGRGRLRRRFLAVVGWAEVRG